MIRGRSVLLVGALVGALLSSCSSDNGVSAPSTAATTTTATARTATSSAPAPTTAAPTPAAPTTATPTTAAPTSAAPTTTADTASSADTYEAAGPYPVGVTTATMANGIKVEIWYPAVDGSSNGTETYDVRDFTAPAIKALLTADIPATYSYAATRDAAVRAGSFPVVLYSHGYSAMRLASSFLTSHLASWGIIAVAPDHPTRDLYHAVAQITPDVVTDPAEDLLGSLDLVTTKGSTPGDLLDGHVDTSHVGAIGHSAGGGTVLKAALDPRISGYVSMASGLGQNLAGATLPSKPSFFMSGSLDGVADPARTHDAFLAVPTPSRFWEIDGMGHNGFDDFCTFGNGTGIIGIAEASGLGPVLDAQPQFRKLGQDGCVPPDVPVASTFPIIDHAVTAFLLQLFGVDATAKGLGPDVGGSYSQKITIEQR